MSDVSTPSRRAATAAKPRKTEAPAASAAQAVLVENARALAVRLLCAALAIDDPDGFFDYPRRLASMARDRMEPLDAGDELDVSSVFDAHALVDGARGIHKEDSPERFKTLCAETAAILCSLSDVIAQGMEFAGDLLSVMEDATITLTSAPPPAQPAASQAPEVIARSGLTLQQAKSVLEEIAARTGTLDEILMMMQTSGDHESYEKSVMLDAAEIIATSIGAMADAATGGGIIGDADRWNYGPNFADAGKAVQS